MGEKGQHCHLITHSIVLKEPVPIAKPRNPGSIWSITSDEERQRILAQIPDGPPICHDLSVLEAPLGEARSAGSPDDDESSLSQLREQLVDHRPTE